MKLLIISFLFFSLFFAFGCLVGHTLIKKENVKINKEALDKYNKEVEEKREVIGKLAKDISLITSDYNNILSKIEQAKQEADRLEKNSKKEIDAKVEEYYNKNLERVREGLIQEEQKLLLEYQENKDKYKADIDTIREELELLKRNRETIIAEQKRQEEIKDNKKFYMLQINTADKEDIKQLKLIEPRLNNKEILNKLIWSTYYQTPYKDLIGRIFGAKKVSGIYKITYAENNKAYIGKSVDVANRWSEHIKSSLEIGSIAKNQLYTLMKEEGAESFTFELLEEVNKDKLLERESYWIKFFETDSYGLNMRV